MTMTNKVSTSSTGSKTWRDLLFILLVGVSLGILGGLVNKQAGTLLGAAFLLSLFGAYNNVFDNNRRLMNGLIAGGLKSVLHDWRPLETPQKTHVWEMPHVCLLFSGLREP
ncbi:MAG: hypothetical protein HC804_08670, partial [Anaerolineae bacterium]|nr:hypothetical protein [Anaerolineae bacterium]